ncbi:MAG TPA: hypothetical protein VMZ00_12425 [Sporichthya sp.]|nr:hypothetical protein [Sporichthya sp.]
MTTSDFESPVLYANVAYDPSKWLPIPTYWGPETWVSAEDWAAEAARDWWVGLDASEQGIKRLEAILTDYAINYGGTDPESPFEVVGYLHLPHPAMFPLYLRVWVDQSPGLTAGDAVLAQDPTAVEPPLVEPFSTDHLGSGLRALLYYTFTPDAGTGSDGLTAMLRYGFSIPELDAVLTVVAVEPDLGRMMQAMDDIDEFVRQVHWGYKVENLVGEA